jgi:hypothetical protein
MRLQYTLRWLLLLIAFSALICWMIVRRRHFLDLASYHEMRLSRDSSGRSPFIREGSGVYREGGPSTAEWHGAMAQKYRRAADAPWLPLPPDPDPAPLLLAECIKWRTSNLGETPAQARDACCRTPRPAPPSRSIPQDRPADP